MQCIDSRLESVMDPPVLEGFSYVQLLGVGSTAVVFEYRQQIVERNVAVKVWRHRLRAHSRDRFEHEAALMARCSASLESGAHALVQVHAAGVTKDGLGYLVMDLAQQGSLSERLGLHTVESTQWLEAHHTLNAVDMLQLGIGLAHALSVLHQQGIVHRDIKPSNVLFDAANHAMLADLGVAADSYETEATGFSPLWAAPEVDAAHSGNEAADIFALAATLYCCVVGHTVAEHIAVARADQCKHAVSSAHDGQAYSSDEHCSDDYETVLLGHLSEAQVPDICAASLLHALQPEIDQRPHSAQAFAQELEQALADITASAGSESIASAAPADSLIAHSHPARAQSVPAAGWLRCAMPWIFPIVTGAAVTAVLIGMHWSASWTTSSSQSGATYATPHPEQHHPSGDMSVVASSPNVPSVQGLHGVFDNAEHPSLATFSWTNTDPQQGDQYAWHRVDNVEQTHDSMQRPRLISSSQVTVDAVHATHICIAVSLVRSSGQMSATPVVACATRPSQVSS
ncbi:kinase [Bifidobacterium dolichotidis]|uniref:non-specific serine/threonine protein kinase n=1 Tax=Bifidobacterium dolichotidis TaxID=2306976 RepID=A0A430FRT0_9BIFI|nr:serine/threonine-protein kinase [Bifidobacterium dolichotidis]RSX55570.1 kinase [Bifidobacterium dolichotidis]